MTAKTVGVIHPGEMGVSLASALVERGATVVWASSGRSGATARRAEKARLTDVGSVDELVKAADAIVSVCPPHAALDVARSIGDFTGDYLDANAISPQTSRAVGEIIESRGARFVDGGIIGGPDSPRLWISGERAEVFVELFAGSSVTPAVVSDAIGAASALKMAYGAWTKGTHALMLAVRALARAEGVESELLSNWQSTSPDLIDRSLRAAEQAATKGWRWVGEMEEIASTFASAGLPSGFHDAAAAIYRRSPHEQGAPVSQATLERVLGGLVGPANGPAG